jgi:lactobin A/cerein 7B family class IIb bacteriocin
MGRGTDTSHSSIPIGPKGMEMYEPDPAEFGLSSVAFCRWRIMINNANYLGENMTTVMGFNEVTQDEMLNTDGGFWQFVVAAVVVVAIYGLCGGSCTEPVSGSSNESSSGSSGGAH